MKTEYLGLFKCSIFYRIDIWLNFKQFKHLFLLPIIGNTFFILDRKTKRDAYFESQTKATN